MPAESMMDGLTAVRANPGAPYSLKQDDGVTAFSASALPAHTGTWRRSESVFIGPARTVGLWLKYDAHASTTSGYAHLAVLVSAEAAQPAIGDDSWFELPFRDDALGTAVALTGGTLPSGADYTKGPLRNVMTLRGGIIVPMAAVANSDKVRQVIELNVATARWLHVIAAERGDTTNRGTLTVGVNQVG